MLVNHTDSLINDMFITQCSHPDKWEYSEQNYSNATVDDNDHTNKENDKQVQ